MLSILVAILIVLVLIFIVLLSRYVALDLREMQSMKRHFEEHATGEEDKKNP